MLASFRRHTLHFTVITCAAFASTAALSKGSLAWWVGAADAKYSTKLAITPSFADPSFIQVGNKYYAYATNNRKGINVQIAVSDNFNDWRVMNQDALPFAGNWTFKEPRVWAPDVIRNKQGKFVMHFSAKPKWSTNHHCIGVAVANTPMGPFVPKPEAFACPLKQGGAIDSAGFLDPKTNNLYAVYKVDGNSIGKGGMCNNMKAPIVATPIMLQRVGDDGMTKIGDPIKIFDRATQDGPLVEAPSLLHDPASGRYILFYSSGCYADPVYDVAYAFSAGTDIKGPYNRVNPAKKPMQGGGVPSQRLYKAGIDGLHAPGGAHAVRCSDGVTRMVLHGYTDGNGRRSMYTARLQINAAKQRITAWAASEAIKLGYRIAGENTINQPNIPVPISLNPAAVASVSASLAAKPQAQSSVDAAAATAGTWDTNSKPTSVASSLLPAATDAGSQREAAPGLGDFLQFGDGGGAAHRHGLGGFWGRDGGEAVEGEGAGFGEQGQGQDAQEEQERGTEERLMAKQWSG